MALSDYVEKPIFSELILELANQDFSKVNTIKNSSAVEALEFFYYKRLSKLYEQDAKLNDLEELQKLNKK